MSRPVGHKKNPSPPSPILPLPVLVWKHHAKVLQPFLTHWEEKKQTPSVLLLTGLKGVGKRSLSHYLAQWALCESAQAVFTPPEESFSFLGETQPHDSNGEPQRPCQHCATCQQILKGISVNLTEILPDEGENTLKVETFRKLKETQGFGTWGASSHRVILIPHAERLTTQAANSLLKMLEEPPEGWMFILTASDPSLLLPTLISRCQIIRLRPFSSETLTAILRDASAPENRIDDAVRFASGSWKRALAATDDEIWQGLQSIKNFVQKPGAELDAVLEWASKAPERYLMLIDELEQNIAARLCTDHLFRQNPEKAVFWVTQSDRVSRARREASVPLNRKLQIQNLLIPWLEAPSP